MSHETGEQQGGQCGCVHLWLLLGLVAGAIDGGAIGYQWGQRLYGWWGGLLGAPVGAVTGAVIGLPAAMLVVVVVGLVACGLSWLEERRKPPSEET